MLSMTVLRSEVSVRMNTVVVNWMFPNAVRGEYNLKTIFSTLFEMIMLYVVDLQSKAGKVDIYQCNPSWRQKTFSVFALVKLLLLSWTTVIVRNQ